MNPKDFPALSKAVAATRADLNRASHLPGEIYTSEEILKMEKETIFMKTWLCVARVEEVEKPGDYITRHITGEPIVIARDNAGELVAWLNQCLHRGVEVAFGSGNARNFKCGYHAWNFDIAGRLVGAPHMRDFGVDLTDARMKPLRIAVWRKWIFINFDADAAPFEDWIAPIDAATPYFRAGEVKMAARFEVRMNCNWKFVTENLIDWYHAMTLHAGTIGKYYKLGRDPLPCKLLPNGASIIEFDGKTRDTDPNYKFPRLPWLPTDSVFSAKGVLFPNVNFSTSAESLRMWHLWPDTAGTMTAVYYILLPETSFSVPDFDTKLQGFVDYIKSVAAEDRVAIESLQRAAGSRNFVPGRMAHMEEQIHHSLRHYLNVMGF